LSKMAIIEMPGLNYAGAGCAHNLLKVTCLAKREARFVDV